MVSGTIIGRQVLLTLLAVSSMAGEPTVRFQTRELILMDGGREKTIIVEVADNDLKRARGLMHRESMLDSHGMLFVFEDEQRRTFWMRNTVMPLSIGYFDKRKILKEIIDMHPDPITAVQPKTYPSRTEAQYALEMNVGWFKRNQIRPGVSFRFADTKVRTH